MRNKISTALLILVLVGCSSRPEGDWRITTYTRQGTKFESFDYAGTKPHIFTDGHTGNMRVLYGGYCRRVPSGWYIKVNKISERSEL